MPHLPKWLGVKKLRRNPYSSSASSKASQESAVPQPVHASGWAALKRDGKFRLKPGRNMDTQVLVLVLGAPSIGKRSLVNMLLYGDIRGGDKLEMSRHLMEDEVPQYYFDGGVYSLKVIFPSDPEAARPDMFPRYDSFAVVLAYNINSPGSLDFISRLHDTTVSACGDTGLKGLHTLLLGLKADSMTENDHMFRETGENLARDWGCQFKECSPTGSESVKSSFGSLVESVSAGGSRTTVGLSQDPKTLQMEAFGKLVETAQSASHLCPT